MSHLCFHVPVPLCLEAQGNISQEEHAMAQEEHKKAHEEHNLAQGEHIRTGCRAARPNAK